MSIERLTQEVINQLRHVTETAIVNVGSEVVRCVEICPPSGNVIARQVIRLTFPSPVGLVEQRVILDKYYVKALIETTVTWVEKYP